MKTTLLFIISLILLSCSTSRNSFRKRKYSRNLFVKTNYESSEKEDHFEDPVIERPNNVLVLPIAEVVLIESEIQSEVVVMDYTESDKSQTSKEVPPFVRQFNSVVLERPIIQRIRQIDEKPDKNGEKENRKSRRSYFHWISLFFLLLALIAFHLFSVASLAELISWFFFIVLFIFLSSIFKILAIQHDSEGKDQFTTAQYIGLTISSIIGIISLIFLLGFLRSAIA